MNKGFTIIELIIVITIVTIVFAISIAAYDRFLSSGVLDSAKFEIIQNIRSAQILAISGKDNLNYGVFITENQYTVYQGASYLNRTISQDKVFVLPNNIRASGLAEINFAKKTGLPNTTGTLILTHTTNNSKENITINTTGLIF